MTSRGEQRQDILMREVGLLAALNKEGARPSFARPREVSSHAAVLVYKPPPS